MQQVRTDPEKSTRQNNFTRVEESVLLQLLITGRVLAMTFGRIYYTTTRDTLSLVGQAEDPRKSHQC
jgi:hypothetical protein